MSDDKAGWDAQPSGHHWTRGEDVIYCPIGSDGIGPIWLIAWQGKWLPGSYDSFATAAAAHEVEDWSTLQTLDDATRGRKGDGYLIKMPEIAAVLKAEGIMAKREKRRHGQRLLAWTWLTSGRPGVGRARFAG